MAEAEIVEVNPVRETKAQRAERLKREKNPWEHLPELREYARRGFHAIPAEWIGTYLRWWGVYTQGDGAGVLGGQNGEGCAVPFFMARVRVTNGLLTAPQLRAIADAAERYARGVADITVRQNIQFHWIEAEALPELLDTLWSAGLTTQGSCGDDTRNVTGCPLAGLDAAELCDASPLAHELTHALVGQADFYNLPRKFKISVTGCRSWCTYPEINDVGLTAVARNRNGADEVGFSLRVGGGLSAEPHLAERLDAFVRWDQVVPVTRAVAEIFRDSEMLRQNRKRARLKYLFLEHGWTAESFLEELHERLGFRLDPAEPDNPPGDVFRDHVGVHPQKRPGPQLHRGVRAPRAHHSGANASCGRSLRALRRRTLAHHRDAESADRERARPRRQSRSRMNFTRRDCTPTPPHSAAGPWPARARNSASWPSPRRRASRVGSSENSRTACRSLRTT